MLDHSKFIHERVGQYACGDNGLPIFYLSDPEILAAFKGLESAN